MAESTSFNVCKSSSFTNHHLLLKFLFKRVTKYLFHHCHKKEIPLKRHLNIFFRLIFSASEDFVKVSQKILRHQIEFISGFILLQNPSTNYPLRIRNFFYLEIRRYTNDVFQGETIQYQNSDAMQHKIHERFQYMLSILSIFLQYIPILSIYILHLFRAL